MKNEHTLVIPQGRNRIKPPHFGPAAFVCQLDKLVGLVRKTPKLIRVNYHL